MSINYCVRIRPKNYEITKLSNTKNSIKVLSNEIYESIDDVQKHIIGKKSVNFVLFDNNFIKSSISLNRNIKGRSAVNSTIFAKLQKEFPNVNNIRFKASVSEDNPKKENINYAVHGLFQDSKVYEKFDSLKTFENCNLITLENYSLYEITKKHVKKESFISIWSDNETFSIVAGDETELYYSRNENLGGSSLSLIEEIVKNITFSKQRVRNKQFDKIYINGPVIFENNILEELESLLKVEIKSLTPLEKNSKISKEDFHKYLISIGSLFIPYELDFTSSKIRSHIQYKSAMNIFIILMLILSTYTFNKMLNSYDPFLDQQSKFEYYTNIIEVLRDDQVIKDSDSELMYKLIDSSLTLKNNDFLNQLKNIKSSIEEISNLSNKIKLDFNLEGLTWEKNKVATIYIDQNIIFDDLQELNEFKSKLETLKKLLINKVEIKSSFNLNNLIVFVSFNIKGVTTVEGNKK